MKLKQVLAGVAAGAVAIGSLTFAAFADNGSDVSFKAGLVFQTDAFSFRNNVYQSEAYHWDEDDTELESPLTFDTWNVQDAEITGDGTYTVSFEKDVLDNESAWNILGLQTNISTTAYPDLTISIDSLKIDGAEIEGAKSAQQTQWGLDYDEYCDIEGESIEDIHYVHFIHVWEEIYHGVEADQFGGKVEVTFTISGLTDDSSGKEDETEEIEPTAGLIFQTNAWTFRGSIYQSEAYYWSNEDDTNKPFETWNVSDAVITGNGTYTASFEKNIMEDCMDGPEKAWNLLKLQTNISSAEYPNLSITIDSLKIDGKELETAKSAVLSTDRLAPDNYSDINGKTVPDAYLVGFFNMWNTDETAIEATDFGGKVEVTFTVSGFTSDEEETTTPAETAPEETTTTPTNAPAAVTTTTTAAETEPETETEAPSETTEPSTTTTTAATTTEPVQEVVDIDEDTGVQLLAAEGVIEDGVELNVVIGNADIGTDTHIYVLDITLVNAEGVTVQPNGSVTVKIPLPEEFDESDAYYVYYQADDGTLTDMHATFENGYVSFTTNHFSRYIITTEKLADDSETVTSGSNQDKNVNTGATILIIPAIAAAAGVVISKKRK